MQLLAHVLQRPADAPPVFSLHPFWKAILTMQLVRIGLNRAAIVELVASSTIANISRGFVNIPRVSISPTLSISDLL